MKLVDENLTVEEIELLKRFSNSDKIYLNAEQYKILSRAGLIKQAINGKSTWFNDISDGFCEISEKGKKYRKAMQNEAQKEKENKFNKITTSITVISSLLMLIIALLQWLLSK